MKTAECMSRLGTETAFDVLAVVEELKAKGRDITSFSIGEPDFNTPDNIKKAGVKAIENNYTHYSPPAGLMELRKTAADYISRTRGVEVKPEEVVITPGSKALIFFAILSCIEKGDEVIHPNPGYPIYESMIDFVGGEAIALPLLESKEFRFDMNDLKDSVTDKTKMIILNSPENPTGGVLMKNDLKQVAEISKDRDILVMSDEVYSRIIYEGEFESIFSIPGMKDRVILADGLSKTYAMTGWRLGFGVMNRELVKAFTRLMTNTNSCAATFTQIAGKEALEGPQHEVDRMVKEFKERRDLIVKGLNEIEDIKCLKPEGAFYVFPNVTKVCERLGFSDSKELQDFLLCKGGVSTLSRMCFGRRNENEDQEYLRLSYATSKENIEKGMRRIEDAINNEKLAKEFLKERK